MPWLQPRLRGGCSQDPRYRKVLVPGVGGSQIVLPPCSLQMISMVMVAVGVYARLLKHAGEVAGLGVGGSKDPWCPPPRPAEGERG